MTDGAELLGSTPLAAALATGDVPAIARALRMDVVVVPQLVTAEGDEQIRVFGSDTADRPYLLFLFSSSESFAAFLQPGDEQRTFAVVAGRSITGFLDEYMAQIDAVVFDPAGPHPMTASPQDVRASLSPQPDDDQVAWIVEGPPSTDPSTAAVQLDLPLAEWAVVDPIDQAARAETVNVVLGRHLIFVKGSRRKEDAIRDWAWAVVEAAEGRRMLALRAGPTKKQGAVFMSLVPEWLPVEGMDQLESGLRGDLRRGESVERISRPGIAALRHSHTANDANVVDFWLEPPSGGEWPRLRFSTPFDDGLDVLVNAAEAMLDQTRFVTG